MGADIDHASGADRSARELQAELHKAKPVGEMQFASMMKAEN